MNATNLLIYVDYNTRKLVTINGYALNSDVNAYSTNTRFGAYDASVNTFNLKFYNMPFNTSAYPLFISVNDVYGVERVHQSATILSADTIQFSFKPICNPNDIIEIWAIDSGDPFLICQFKVQYQSGIYNCVDPEQSSSSSSSSSYIEEWSSSSSSYIEEWSSSSSSWDDTIWVCGTDLTESIQGQYNYDGDYDSKPSFKLSGAEWYIWYKISTSKYFISAVKGVSTGIGVKRWQATNTNTLIDTYVSVVDGTCTTSHEYCIPG
jgi:hypothetical protein